MTRAERFEMRLTADEKALIQKAVQIIGSEAGQWARIVLLREAKKIVRQDEE